MIIEEKHITRHNIHKVAKNFLVFNEIFRKIRPELDVCFICKKTFEDQGNIHLTFIVGHENVVICDGCLVDIEMNHPDVKVVELLKKNQNE